MREAKSITPLFAQSYYLIKPILPRRLQIAVRRWAALRKYSEYRNVWPIQRKAALHPDRWIAWPDARNFALVLTHDVESRRGRDRCNRLAGLEKNLGFRSCFNFVAEGYAVSPALRESLAEQGFEVGIHGVRHNGNPFRSERVFRRQAAKINHYLAAWNAVGFRCPCMYHRLDWIADLKVQYDCSTFDTDPFEPQSDGVETIFPFWVGSGSRGYVELPYTLPQDFTLFILLAQHTTDIWKRKLAWIAECGGMALLNTHPDYMNFGEKPLGPDEYPAGHYEDFLRHINEQYRDSIWHVLPRQLASWAALNNSSSATPPYQA